MATVLTWTLTLMAAGGFIAWLGDRLGTRIGKKRLSVFGLRPRHTALLGTVASGVVIALLTLLVLFGYDASVRRALLHGGQIVARNQYLTRRNALYQQQITVAENRLVPLTQQLTQARSALAQQQAQLNASRRALAQTQVQLTAARQSVTQAQSGVVAAQKSLHAAQQQAATAQTQTRKQQRIVSALAAQEIGLRATVQGLGRARDQLARRAEASRGDLVFHGRTDTQPGGEEIGRVVVRAAQPVRTVEGQINAFLDTLSRKALARGGRAGANGRAVTLAIVPPGTDNFRALSPAAEKQAVRALAQNIAGQQRGTDAGSVVLIAHAPINSFRGEQSETSVRPYDNVLLYADNTAVASTTVDGTQSETQVLGALQAFLTNTVRPAALQKGLIPQNDPQSGRALVGAVDESTTLALVTQIRSSGANVRVSAFADGDIYSSGPLRLRLTAAPAP